MSGFKYFQSVEGHAVSRAGTSQFIGATRFVGGFEWTPDPVAIPIGEYNRHARDYLSALAGKLLIELSEPDALALQIKLDNERAAAAETAQAEMDKLAADEKKVAEPSASSEPVLVPDAPAAAPTVGEAVAALDGASDGSATSRKKR